MTGPDEYRAPPPGSSWPPYPTDPATPARGWPPDPQRPGPGWSAAVAGPGGTYLAPGAGPSAPAGPSGPAGRAKLGPAKLFGLVIAALGALNFVFGFLPQVTASRLDESLSVYAVGPGYVPILLLIAGLLALAAFLPGSERSRLAVAAVSVGGAAGALISLGTTGSVELLTTAQVSKGPGAVLLTIFGIIQAVVAIAAYVVGADFGARSGQAAVVTGARDPATVGYDSGPPRPAVGSTGDLGWTADGPVRATPWSAPAPAPAPGPAAAPGGPPQGSVAYYAGYSPVPGSTTGSGGPAASGWAPPADDDRPTGPQRVAGPNADAPNARQAPAERELPRVAPIGPDERSTPTEQADPMTQVRDHGAAHPPAETPDDAFASGPTEAHRIPPRQPRPEESGRS